MGFWDNIKNGMVEQLPENWLQLDSIDTLQKMKEQSFERPVVVFKHSTSCGVSSMAKHQLEVDWDIATEEAFFYYLDLWTYRNISNAVAEEFKVVHQSPQIIILKDGEVVFTTSHHAIHLAGLKNALAQI